MIPFRFRPRPVLRDESGIALITVIAVGFVMVLLATAILTYAVNGLRQAGRDQNFQAAITAADAGVQDYLYRINSDSTYITRSTVPNICIPTQPKPANPDPANTAMGGWAPIPGNPSGAAYRYDIDLSSLCSAGVVLVTSTGRVGAVARTELATVKRKSFLDYLYYTDVETTDPAAYTSNPFLNNAAYPAPDNDPAHVCGRHYYDPSADSRLPAPRPDDFLVTPGCSAINFGGGDVINGPMHSNDAILVCGAVTFNGPAYTSWTGSSPGTPTTNKHWRSNGNCGASTPLFNGNTGNKCLGSGPTNDMCYELPLAIPPSNSGLKSETSSALASPPGCLFTGPTKITMRADGKMDVLSPDTAAAGANPGCVPGSGMAIPANGVVYVQNVPSGATSTACTSGNGVYFDGNGAPVTSTTPGATKNLINPVGYPVSGDITDYGCKDGDVFISGVVNGRLTVGSEHDTILTDDITYNSGVSGNDVLGLVANNNVLVYHPIQCTSFDGTGHCTSSGISNIGSATQDLKIAAAILCVTHSFTTQWFQYGASLGTLTLTGAIAQKFRGAVGVVGGSGYKKNYLYDQRLSFASPPKFLDPVQASFGVAKYSEITRAY